MLRKSDKGDGLSLKGQRLRSELINPKLFDQVIIEITMLTNELLSLTPRRLYLQPPVSQHQQIGSQVANEGVSGCGIAISIAGFHTILVFLFDLEAQVLIKDKL